jgi:transposase
MALTTYQGLRMSTRNAEIARLVMSGHSYSDVADLLDIPVSQVTTCCTRLRERGLTIPRSRRFKLVAVSKSGERFEFVGKKDVEQRGGYDYRCAHKAAQKGGSYLGLTWSKESI